MPPTASLALVMILIPLIATTLANTATANDLAWKLSGGFDFSRGRYGLDEATKLYYVPLGLTLDYQQIRWRALVPILALDGPTEIIPGAGPTGSQTNSGSSFGLGQVQTSLSYLFYPLAEPLPFVEVSGQIRIPTETDDDLGTGEWAFAPRIDLFQRYGSFIPFIGFGRKFYTGSGLDDRFFTSIGSSWEFNDAISVGIAYDWFESTTGSTKDDAHELVPFVNYRFKDRYAIGPYAVVGLSRGAPDYGLGFTVSVRLR